MAIRKFDTISYSEDLFFTKTTSFPFVGVLKLPKHELREF